MPRRRFDLPFVVLLALVFGGCERSPSPAGQPPSTAGSAPRVSASPSSPLPSATPPALAAQPEPDAQPEPAAGTKLRVLTYNVLATPVFTELRTRAILDILAASKADVIALQEVVPWFSRALVKEPWVQDYGYVKEGGFPFAPGGQLILARHPATTTTVEVLPGRQRRTLVVADLVIAGRPLRVATSHLESFLDDGPARATQLERIFRKVGADVDGLVLGDLNFGDGAQPETSALDARFVDPWPKLSPGSPGYTWNNDDNPLAGIGAFVGEPNRRLDRILMRSPGWTPIAIRIIGDAPAGKRRLTVADRQRIAMPERPPTTDEPTIDVFPSDHYGLVADFEWRK